MLKQSVAALSLALLTACTTIAADPLDRLQQQAWAEPWAMCSGDWEPKPSCSCRNRSLWLLTELRTLGYDPTILVGYRSDQPTVLHMTITVDGLVLDYDGLHPLEAYYAEWEPAAWCNWRMVAKHHTGKAY